MYSFNVIENTDPQWPKRVSCCQKLWYAGNIELLSKQGVSIVGTRNPSETGRIRAEECTDVLGQNYIIVSGLASGIDGIAHLEALSKGYNTIAVIGTPIDQYYPKEHERLQQLIAQKGLVLSMFEPGSKVEKYFFMKRNLLMSQISIASVVVEDTLLGGAMGQARYALKEGNKVYTFDFENYKALKGSVLVNSPQTVLMDISKKTFREEQLFLF